MKNISIYLLCILILFSCRKEEILTLQHCPSKTIEGKVIGQSHADHHATVPLKNEIALIYRNHFDVLHFDSTENQYNLEISSTDAQVDGEDLIVLKDNTFIRLDIENKQQTTLFSPSELNYFAFDYIITPEVGITYFGTGPFGESAGEPAVFGFYDFDTQDHTKIYDFKGDIDPWLDEWYTWPDEFFTTKIGDKLILTIQETKDSETNKILQIDTTNQTIIRDTVIKDISFKIRNVIDVDNYIVSYNDHPRNPASHSKFAYYNASQNKFTNGNLVKEGYGYLEHPIGGNVWSTLNEAGYLSVLYERQFVDWVNQKSYYTIDEVQRNWDDVYFHYNYDHHEALFIYYYRESMGYVVRDGCISHIINATDPIKHILHMDDDKLILSTESSNIILYELN